MRVLLVEDDPELRRRLTERLVAAGIAVDSAASAGDARDWPDIDMLGAVILDLGLPDGDGIDVLRHWRGAGRTVPILILTARGEASEKVAGLDLGADDYMVKPFDVGEFEARVRSILRRQAGLHASDVQIGPVRFDMANRRFHVGDEPLDLPARELALLELFFLRAGRVVGKEAIVQSLTSLEESLSDNAIEQYVSRLRRRLHPHGLTLRTARGLGYMLERPPA